jgi:hypothetical protein
MSNAQNIFFLNLKKCISNVWPIIMAGQLKVIHFHGLLTPMVSANKTTQTYPCDLIVINCFLLLLKTMIVFVKMMW